MGKRQAARVQRATSNASSLLKDWTASPPAVENRCSSELVRSRLKPDAILEGSLDLITTEIGFVTMAVLPRFASQVGSAIAVPGLDDQCRRGFLILREGEVPYHSLAGDPEQAVSEANGASERAGRLINYYGNKESLRVAAKNAPWHMFSVVDDVERAGLCPWGVTSWLNRMRLRAIASRVGLPRIFIKMAGGYGDRITAMTLMRQAEAARVNDIPTGLNAPPTSSVVRAHRAEPGRPRPAQPVPVSTVSGRLKPGQPDTDTASDHVPQPN